MEQEAFWGRCLKHLYGAADEKVGGMCRMGEGDLSTHNTVSSNLGRILTVRLGDGYNHEYVFPHTKN